MLSNLNKAIDVAIEGGYDVFAVSIVYGAVKDRMVRSKLSNCLMKIFTFFLPGPVLNTYHVVIFTSLTDEVDKRVISSRVLNRMEGFEVIDMKAALIFCKEGVLD